MALVTAATDRGIPHHGVSRYDRLCFIPLNISPRLRLDEVVKRIGGLPFEATDCALPMIWAREHQVQRVRRSSPTRTVKRGRETSTRRRPCVSIAKQFVGDAKSVVVGMTSNGFTIADPNDRGMLDVVGFDTTAPAVIADFVRE